MYSPLLQLLIGTLLGIGFLAVSFFILIVLLFWLLAWMLPTAYRVWGLWRAFSSYRRGESAMVAVLSAISPKAAYWVPRLSPLVFHLLGRPAPPNWRAGPPSFAEASSMAHSESSQEGRPPNEAWLRQAERDRMMASRNEPQPSNIRSDHHSFSSVPPPSYQSVEAAEGGWFVAAAISAVQFIQNAAQQLLDKLHHYRANGHPFQQLPPSQQPHRSAPSTNGVRRRHVPESVEYHTPEASAPPPR